MTYRSPYSAAMYTAYEPSAYTGGKALSWVVPTSASFVTGISIYDSSDPDIKVGDEVEMKVTGKVTSVNGKTVQLDNDHRKTFYTPDIKSGVMSHKLVKRPKRRPSPGEEFNGHELRTWTFPKGTIIRGRDTNNRFALDGDRKWVSLQGTNGRDGRPYAYLSSDFGGVYVAEFIPAGK